MRPLLRLFVNKQLMNCKQKVSKNEKTLQTSIKSENFKFLLS